MNAPTLCGWAYQVPLPADQVDGPYDTHYTAECDSPLQTIVDGVTCAYGHTRHTYGSLTQQIEEHYEAASEERLSRI